MPDDPAAHARLVGNDDESEARLAEPGQRLAHARKQRHLVGMAQVTRVHVDRAVAIQENALAMNEPGERLFPLARPKRRCARANPGRGCESQRLAGESRVAHQPRRIAGAPRALDGLELASDHALADRDHLTHRISVFASEVVSLETAAGPVGLPREQPLHRGAVRRGQIPDMDIIADRGAIRRRIIRAVDLD